MDSNLNCDFLSIMGGEQFSLEENIQGSGIRLIRMELFFVYKIVAFCSILFYAIKFLRLSRGKTFTETYNSILNSSVFIYLTKPKREIPEAPEPNQHEISLPKKKNYTFFFKKKNLYFSQPHLRPEDLALQTKFLNL